MRPFIIMTLILGASVILLSMDSTGSVMSNVSYEKDIRPIFKKHCAGCHMGSLDYTTAYRQRQKIYDKFVKQGEMPPPYASRPSVVEVKLVKAWVEGGAKR